MPDTKAEWCQRADSTADGQLYEQVLPMET